MTAATWYILMATMVVVALDVSGVRRSSFLTQRVDLPVSEALAAHTSSVAQTPVRELGPTRSAAVVTGIAFGRTDAFTERDRQVFRASGLWHLVAASGQNVALVVALCVFAATGIGGGRSIALITALMLVPLYVCAVGGGASIVRAGVTCEICTVAWLAGRRVDVRHVTAVAAFVIILLWPGAWRGLGFQLSFVCVIALMLWGSRATDALEAFGLPTACAAGVSATAICTLATAPVLMATVGRAPMLGGITNLVAVPTASFVLVAALPASLLASVMPGIAHVVLVASAVGGSVIVACAEVGARIPAASTTSPIVGYGVPLAGLMFAERERIARLGMRLR